MTPDQLVRLSEALVAAKAAIADAEAALIEPDPVPAPPPPAPPPPPPPATGIELLDTPGIVTTLRTAAIVPRKVPADGAGVIYWRRDGAWPPVPYVAGWVIGGKDPLKDGDHVADYYLSAGDGSDLKETDTPAKSWAWRVAGVPAPAPAPEPAPSPAPSPAPGVVPYLKMIGETSAEVAGRDFDWAGETITGSASGPNKDDGIVRLKWHDDLDGTGIPGCERTIIKGDTKDKYGTYRCENSGMGVKSHRLPYGKRKQRSGGFMLPLGPMDAKCGDIIIFQDHQRSGVGSQGPTMALRLKFGGAAGIYLDRAYGAGGGSQASHLLAPLPKAGECIRYRIDDTAAPNAAGGPRLFVYLNEQECYGKVGAGAEHGTIGETYDEQKEGAYLWREFGSLDRFTMLQTVTYCVIDDSDYSRELDNAVKNWK